jgi:hypothetical protein
MPMKDIWYGDKRDIVKWSTLVTLARNEKLESIIYIPYFRQSNFGQITIAGVPHEVPQDVLFHFRNIFNCKNIINDIPIKVLKDVFTDQGVCQNLLLRFIENCKHKKKSLVFLDPDTGLEPITRPTLCHILGKSVREVWENIPKNWILAIYQHQTNRNGQSWISAKQSQFKEAIGVGDGMVKVASGNIVNDVVIFFAHKI